MKNRRGIAITAILTIGALVILGATAIVSSLNLNQKHTTSSKAAGCDADKCPGSGTNCVPVGTVSGGYKCCKAGENPANTAWTWATWSSTGQCGAGGGGTCVKIYDDCTNTSECCPNQGLTCKDSGDGVKSCLKSSSACTVTCSLTNSSGKCCGTDETCTYISGYGGYGCKKADGGGCVEDCSTVKSSSGKCCTSGQSCQYQSGGAGGWACQTAPAAGVTPAVNQNPPDWGKDQGTGGCGSGQPTAGGNANYQYGSCYQGRRCVQCQHTGKWLSYNCFEDDKTCAGTDPVYCPPEMPIQTCNDGSHKCCNDLKCIQSGNNPDTTQILISQCKQSSSDATCNTSKNEYCGGAGKTCNSGDSISTSGTICESAKNRWCCAPKPTAIPVAKCDIAKLQTISCSSFQYCGASKKPDSGKNYYFSNEVKASYSDKTCSDASKLSTIAPHCCIDEAAAPTKQTCNEYSKKTADCTTDCSAPYEGGNAPKYYCPAAEEPTLPTCNSTSGTATGCTSKCTPLYTTGNYLNYYCPATEAGCVKDYQVCSTSGKPPCCSGGTCAWNGSLASYRCPAAAPAATCPVGVGSTSCSNYCSGLDPKKTTTSTANFVADYTNKKYWTDNTCKTEYSPDTSCGCTTVPDETIPEGTGRLGETACISGGNRITCTQTPTSPKTTSCTDFGWKGTYTYTTICGSKDEGYPCLYQCKNYINNWVSCSGNAQNDPSTLCAEDTTQDVTVSLTADDLGELAKYQLTISEFKICLNIDINNVSSCHNLTPPPPGATSHTASTTFAVNRKDSYKWTYGYIFDSAGNLYQNSQEINLGGAYNFPADGYHLKISIKKVTN